MGVGHRCVLRLCGLVLVAFGAVGCGGPPPADQFKPISDAKKAKLTAFLKGRQSELGGYKATVTEETDIDRRSDHTHVGVIEFDYTVTRPEGPRGSQGVETVVAEYHFSAKEKKWVHKGCVVKVPGVRSQGEDPLVTFQEVVNAAFP